MKKIMVVCQKNEIFFSEHLYKLGLILKDKYKGHDLSLALISDDLIKKQTLIQIFLLEICDLPYILVDFFNKNKFCYKNLFDKVTHIENKQDLIEVSLSKDIIYILTCKYIFPKQLCETIEIYNLHCGLLPSYRGILPTFWSFLEGNHCGVTLHRINSEIDRGEIVANYQIPQFYSYYITLKILYIRGIELIEHGIQGDHSNIPISNSSYYKYPSLLELIKYKFLRILCAIKLDK